MSKKDKTTPREILTTALKDSFRKMLVLRKIGPPVVTSNGNGVPVIITPKETQKLADND